MKLKPWKDGFIVIPETEFEEDFLRKYNCQNSLKCFLKHGISIDEVTGFVFGIECPGGEIDEKHPEG